MQGTAPEAKLIMQSCARWYEDMYYNGKFKPAHWVSHMRAMQGLQGDTRSFDGPWHDKFPHTNHKRRTRVFTRGSAPVAPSSGLHTKLVRAFIPILGAQRGTKLLVSLGMTTEPPTPTSLSTRTRIW